MTRSCASPHHHHTLRPHWFILFHSQCVLRCIQMLLNRCLQMNVGGSGKEWVFLIWVMGAWWAVHQDKCRRCKLLSQGVELTLTRLSLRDLRDLQWEAVLGSRQELQPDSSEQKSRGGWKESRAGSSRLRTGAIFGSSLFPHIHSIPVALRILLTSSPLSRFSCFPFQALR